MKERIKAGRELAKKHIDKKLSRRMMIYFFMSIAILGFVAYEIIIGSIDRWIALVTIVLGVGL